MPSYDTLPPTTLTQQGPTTTHAQPDTSQDSYRPSSTPTSPSSTVLLSSNDEYEHDFGLEVEHADEQDSEEEEEDAQGVEDGSAEGELLTVREAAHAPRWRPRVSRASANTVVNADGYQYTRYHSSSKKLSYRCSRHRSTQCKAKLHFIIARMEYEICGIHICARLVRPFVPVVDIAENMKETVDRVAVTNMNLTPTVIWNELRSEFYPTGLNLVQPGLSREQVINRVHRVRRSHFGGDIHGIVEVPPLSLVSGSALPFSISTILYEW